MAGAPGPRPRRPGADPGARATPQLTRSGKIRAVLIDVVIMVGSFVGATALAGLLGAINLGTALAFGQIAFAIATVFVILRRA